MSSNEPSFDNNQEGQVVSLSEQDYLKIFDIVARLHRCVQRQDFIELLEKSVFPLLEVHSAMYGWTDQNLKTHSLIQIGAPQVSATQEEVGELTKYSPHNQLMFTQSRPVLASHVDFPWEEENEVRNMFLDQIPAYRSFGKTYKGALLAFDKCEPGLGIGFHRHRIEKPISLREVRLVELLRPHIIHTIKTFTLREELKNLQSVIHRLMEIPEPVVLLNNDLRVSIGNPMFKDLLHIEDGDWLPEELMERLRKEVEHFTPPYEVDPPNVGQSFYTLPAGELLLNLTAIQRDGEDSSPYWLLRFKPTDAPHTRMMCLLQKAGLTPRETEVAILLRDTMSNEEISARLFISNNTVKKHIKEIYKKFHVTDRASLTALLNE